jgi:hypothetical protein
MGKLDIVAATPHQAPKANNSIQVFLLLVAEMTLFMVLILPIPFTMRRKMFTFM